MNRNQRGLDWRYKSAISVLSAAAMAASLGAMIGLIGGWTPESARAVVGTVCGIVLLGTVIFPSVPIPQRDVETAQSLLSRGPLAWAIVNGGLLGVAVTSRIGFWLWYAIPIACFVLGSWRLGGLIYGWYGLWRLIVIVLSAAVVRRRSFRWADRLTGSGARRVARVASRAALLPIAVAYIAVSGF